MKNYKEVEKMKSIPSFSFLNGNPVPLSKDTNMSSSKSTDSVKKLMSNKRNNNVISADTVNK